MTALTRRTALKAGTAAALLPLAAPLVKAQGPAIRIGLIQPMSGPLSAYGQETQPVVEMIAGNINAAGGIKSLGGARLEIVLADNSGSPARAANEARRLVTQEKVAMLAGAIITHEALAVGPALDELKVPMISFVSGTSRSPYLFSFGLPYDRGYAESMVQFLEALRKDHGAKVQRVVTASSNYEAGQQITGFLTAKLKARGFELVGDVPLDTKAQDLGAAMLKIRSLRPDVVVGLQTQRELLLLQRARFDLQYFDGIFVSNLGISDPSVWTDLGPEIAAKVLTRNAFGLALYAPSLKIDALTAIAAQAKQLPRLRHGLGQFSIFAAQALLVIKETLEKAASVDPQKLTEELGRLELPLGHPSMILPRAGGVAFAEDRLARDASTLIVQWDADKTLQVVHPAQFATRPPVITTR
ncbi:ABC transporter substrate-binding protein [Phreatobacter stygius]|uniref:ABC transporter substrate-binding protein n=1 Tax=Phreatobacter stygius TaxID=1940610 RepID=A0A4D7AWX7_9HYPH|nr:ABC transporter substrate-binding protein [Phreatobacter stygius]QCI63348.1 ABC transporter substrate-binding protein [Phreatobacter stygius]